MRLWAAIFDERIACVEQKSAMKEMIINRIVSIESLYLVNMSRSAGYVPPRAAADEKLDLEFKATSINVHDGFAEYTRLYERSTPILFPASVQISTRRLYPTPAAPDIARRKLPAWRMAMLSA